MTNRHAISSEPEADDVIADLAYKLDVKKRSVEGRLFLDQQWAEVARLALEYAAGLQAEALKKYKAMSVDVPGYPIATEEDGSRWLSIDWILEKLRDNPK